MKSAFFSRHLLAATLLLSGAVYFARPAWADTPAGTTISNTATATFIDSGTNSTYNATSNTVTVVVAEVPGITITAGTPSNTTPNAGDLIYVDFVVTNTGNDPTKFFIPNAVTFNTAAGPAPVVEGPIQIIKVNATTLTTPTDVTGTGINSPSVAPKPLGDTTGLGTVTVRVPIRVNSGASQNDNFTVSLGSTNPVDGQNQDLTGTPTAKDVYTLDNLDSDNVPGETPGNLNTQASPLIKKAMATSAIVKVNAKLQAYATVLKAIGSYSNNGTPSDLTDDLLTYKLAQRVEDPSPAATGVANANLFGTAISLTTPAGTSVVSRVLVSDAIPAGTNLSPTDPTATAAGWQVVYTTSDLATIRAHKAAWTTIRPTPASSITRVGFIFDAGATGIPKGTTISGFTIVVTPKSTFTGGQIANIAQVLGQSQPSVITAGVPADPIPGTSTQLVYDESGDQTANDGLGSANPDPTTTGGATIPNGGISDGVANPALDGIDPGTGTDPTVTTTTNNAGTNLGANNDADGGEDTVFTIATTPLNGPASQPGAVGPTNNNDDFTNKSINLPAGTKPTDTIDPAAVTFNNTVQNTSGAAQTISLLPTPPAAPGDLPNGTYVTITAGSSVAVYLYNGTAFVWQATGGGNTSVGTSATAPAQFVNVPANDNAAGGPDEKNYTVTVDLPAGQTQFTGFPVPITAFVDQGVTPNGVPDATDPSNITIDRVYTGYIRLDKKARILDTNGTTELAPFSATPPTGLLTTGRFVEYQITYTNVSIAAGTGTNNVLLSASNVVITEDGIPVANVNTNNWADTPAGQTDMLTSHVTGTAVGAGTVTGAVTFFSGNPATTASTDAANGATATTGVTKYVYTLANPLNPTQSGTLTFRRKLN